MDITPLGLAIFIVITGLGQLYFSHKRKQIIRHIHESRSQLQTAIKDLHEKV